MCNPWQLKQVFSSVLWQSHRKSPMYLKLPSGVWLVIWVHNGPHDILKWASFLWFFSWRVEPSRSLDSFEWELEIAQMSFRNYWLGTNPEHWIFFFWLEPELSRIAESSHPQGTLVDSKVQFSYQCRVEEGSSIGAQFQACRRCGHGPGEIRTVAG